MVIIAKEKELNISTPCDDCLKLKVIAYFTDHNDILIAARRGEDKFFLSPRGPESDIPTDAYLIPARKIIIGYLGDEGICGPRSKEGFLIIHPQSLYEARILIAAATCVYLSSTFMPNAIKQTAEYRQALAENRLTVI